jgi:hypothetical protein
MSEIIYIAKDGQNLGGFDEAGVTEGLRTGYFKPEDAAWKEGMAEWTSLKAVLNPEQVTPPPLPKAKAAHVPKTKKSTEPPPVHLATQKQIDYIESMGGRVTAAMTVPEASMLIQSLLADPKVQERREKQWAQEDKKREREDRQRENHPILYAHKDVDAAKLALREFTNNAESTDPDDLKAAQDDLKYAEESRVEQWRAMFTTEAFESDEGAKLYQYASQYNQPTTERVIVVLADLDVQGELWEKKSSVSFFTQMESRFPQLRKRR